jgi:hypothetical protein
MIESSKCQQCKYRTSPMWRDLPLDMIPDFQSRQNLSCWGGVMSYVNFVFIPLRFHTFLKPFAC